MSIKKITRNAAYTVVALVALVFTAGLILALLPTKSKTNHIGISAEQAEVLRQRYSGAHDQFTTTDGETLFCGDGIQTPLLKQRKILLYLFFMVLRPTGAHTRWRVIPYLQGDIPHLVWIIGDMAYQAETEGTLQT